MHEVEVLASALARQSWKVNVLVNVVAHLLPQAVEGSAGRSKHKSDEENQYSVQYLRHRAGEVDSGQMGAGGYRVTKYRSIGGHKVNDSVGYSCLSHDVENAPVGQHSSVRGFPHDTVTLREVIGN